MKSCSPPLQGAQSQLSSAAAPSLICARTLMFAREEEEEDGASRGTEGGRGGLALLKERLYRGDSAAKRERHRRLGYEQLAVKLGIR